MPKQKQNKTIFNGLNRRSIAAAAILGGVAISNPVLAQSSAVSVDLSVLNDGGYTSNAGVLPGYAGGSNIKLKMPGAAAPRSSYFGPTVTIKNPLPAEAPSTSALSVADTVPAPAPEPAPEPEMAAEVPAAPSEPEMAPAAPAEPTATAEAVPLVPESTGESAEAPPPPPEPETAEQDPAPAVTASEPTETAAATPGPAEMGPGRAMQVMFDDAASGLPDAATAGLKQAAQTLAANEDLRVQLMAYAGGKDLSASQARRLSLSRALSVRSFFIEHGVRSTRIDVRALGDKTDEEPLNRVDVNLTER